MTPSGLVIVGFRRWILPYEPLGQATSVPKNQFRSRVVLCRVDNTFDGSKNVLSNMSYDDGNCRFMTNGLLEGLIQRATSGEFGLTVARLRLRLIPGASDV